MHFDKWGEKNNSYRRATFYNALTKGRASMHDVSVGPAASTI